MYVCMHVCMCMCVCVHLCVCVCVCECVCVENKHGHIPVRTPNVRIKCQDSVTKVVTTKPIVERMPPEIATDLGPNLSINFPAMGPV